MNSANIRKVSTRRADTAVLMSVCSKDNPAHFATALESVLGQSYADLHLYLMTDGGVGPATTEIIDACDDARLHVRHTAHGRGLAFTLNTLIEESLAGGYDYFARMDADDIAAPNRLEKQTAFLRENPTVDVVGAHCEEIDDEGSILFLKRLPTTDEALKREILTRCPFVHPSVVFRRRVFESGIRYCTNSHLTEDMFLWVDLAQAGAVFANIPEPLLQYRITADFYNKRSGFKKAISEFKAKRYIADRLGIGGAKAFVVPPSAFILRMLPTPMLRLCYRWLR